LADLKDACMLTRRKTHARKSTERSGKNSGRKTPNRGGVSVPAAVQNAARLAFELKKIGFRGATDTGWKRARKLANGTPAKTSDLRTMRAWFARHKYASLPTYESWVKAGKPRTTEWMNRRGIIAILCWGGPAAMRWVESDRVARLLAD
jgi:hypothetical protein